MLFNYCVISRCLLLFDLRRLLETLFTFRVIMSERERYMATLQDMGFGPNRATRALKATGYKVLNITYQSVNLLEHWLKTHQKATGCWVRQADNPSVNPSGHVDLTTEPPALKNTVQEDTR